MKIKSLLALFVATTVFSSAATAQEYLDCAVMSDIHIMSPSLLRTESKAFDPTSLTTASCCGKVLYCC